MVISPASRVPFITCIYVCETGTPGGNLTSKPKPNVHTSYAEAQTSPNPDVFDTDNGDAKDNYSEESDEDSREEDDDKRKADS